LLHNSNRFPATTKHGGAWGLPGTKYGEFACNTCHAKNTGNIKRVKKALVAPNSPTDQFPIEVAPPAGGINFQDTREGSSDFGDDARAVNTESTNICEACHTYDPAQLVGVKFHGYDMSSLGDSGHYNKADCMICHPHSQGFKPQACDSCHGYPPIDTSAGGTTGLANNPYSTGSATAGAHQKHAIDLGYACTNCHDSYNMPKESTAKPGFGDISIAFNTFSVTTGSYTGQAAVSYNDVIGTGGETCATVYCHSNGQSADGTSATPSVYSTPNWSGAAACGTCHSDTDPATGSHTVHIGTGATCNDCHAGNVHVDRQIDVTVGTYTAGGAPGNGYGSCSTTSCHDQGRGGLATTPTWGNNVTDCSECHASAPATGGHTVHLAASIAGTAIACSDCHDAATDPATETAPAAGHRDTNIDVTAGSYPVDKVKNTAFTTCSTAACHQTGQAVNDYTVTSNWDIDDANCTQCHEATPATGSHDTHVNTAGYDCSSCHTGATKDTSYNNAAHGDSNIDVAVGNYIANRTNQAYGTAFTSCDTISCHGDGLNAGGGNTPVWGVAAGCTACHDIVGTPTGSHAIHLTYTGNSCTECHDNADVAGTAPGQHGDGNVDVFATVAGDLGYPQDAAIGSASWTGCTAASCHDDGRSANTTPNWNVTPATCTACHDAIPATGSHASHVADAAVACTDCHAGAIQSSTKPTAGHDNGTIDTTAAHGYNANPDLGGAFDTCSTASCHNDGRNSGLTGTWGTPLANCAECHAVQPATGSHTTHLAIYACATCHTGVTEGTTAGAGHRDGSITTAASTGLGAKLIGTAFTSCGTNNCHGSGSPIWGTDLSTNDQCTQCHGQLVAGPATDIQKAPGGAGVDTNGDSINTDAQVGAHQVHLNPTMSKVVACSACHTVPGTVTAAGHIDSALPAELTFSGLALGGLDGQAAVTPGSCATTYCHDGNAFKNGGIWDNGTLAPTWNDPTFVTGVAADCDNCHGYPPAGGHIANSNCITCHDNVNANNISFVDNNLHVDGIVQASGGDSCTDCHNADIDDALSGVHDSHTDTATFLGVKTISGGGNGGAGWYTTSYVSGKPNFGCGECHPNEGIGHPANGLNIDLDPAGETPTVGSLKLKNIAGPTNPTLVSRSSVTCSNIYCHSDAGVAPAYATTPNWYGGTVSGNCNDCHNNGPASGTHANHTVGIHYETLYNGASGLMASGAASNAAHGDAATADIIGCQSCHNNTVAVEINDQNSVCATCHDGGTAALQGNMTINTLGSTHVNGTADVVFDNFASFKSKAQVRDDITTAAELNANWTRSGTYKTATGFDTAKVATPSYAGGSCSNVSCHNGIATPTWNTGFAGNCRACHTTLP